MTRRSLAALALAVALALPALFAADRPAGAQAGASPEVAYALDHAADTYGVPRRCLWTIARRETGGTFWPWVTNRRSGAAGLMQYLWSTWSVLAPRAGYGGASPYEPWAAAHVAAWAIANPGPSQGGLRHWGGC